MSKSLKLKFYSDPGHGWVAVKRELLENLGIAHRISVYSYQKGNTVYLEEDCDFSVLIEAFKQNRISFELDHKYTDNRSPIRSYENYAFSAPKFYDYVLSFYGVDGLYAKSFAEEGILPFTLTEIRDATDAVLKKHGCDAFCYDSVDRERVRDVVLELRQGVINYAV